MPDGKAQNVARDPMCELSFADGEDVPLIIDRGKATITPVREGAVCLLIRFQGLEARVKLRVLLDEDVCRDATPVYQGKGNDRELTSDPNKGEWSASRFDVIVLDSLDSRPRRIGRLHSQDPGILSISQRFSAELLGQVQVQQEVSHGIYLFVRSPPRRVEQLDADVEGAVRNLVDPPRVGGHGGMLSVELVRVLWEGRASAVTFRGPPVIAIRRWRI
jgi:hypothetical protein